MSFQAFDIAESPSLAHVIKAREYTAKSKARCIAIISHPYGPLGGSQDDHVVCSLARHLQQHCGITCFTFNFSRPTSWTGRRERDEYLRVARYAREKYPQLEKILFCGYSYGTLCLPNLEDESSLHAPPSTDTRCGLIAQTDDGGMNDRPGCLRVGYILVSPLLPPVSTILTLSRGDAYRHVRNHPHLVVWGQRDEFTGSRRLSKAWDMGKVVSGASHFWHEEDDLNALLSHVSLFVEEFVNL